MAAAAAVIPSKMTALYYEKARHFSVIQADLPTIDEHEVLLKGFEAHGVTLNGGFAQYAKFHAAKVFPIKNLTDEQATLVEPASCAVHGLDKIRPKPGSECLLIGAGPTGLILAQLLNDSGKIRTEGMVTDIFKIEEYQQALDKMASRQCLKIAVRPTH
ncbi:hypothetical protein PtA15_8A760 [Puccinia triticina]|uniref:Alcohol dehydrogenase-like C-terminal domain-containing protein n=1 Tax=Puccinia triticina TaxID=208348 RepID=A0ABY7CU31_9BASI|nr:uncharacterized protein PtA15_8A760 [Puccinia triticina]WAQ87853.1 hypothetical protein PtA15_8A760 [Puccinia triticina]